MKNYYKNSLILFFLKKAIKRKKNFKTYFDYLKKKKKTKIQKQ